MTVRQGAALGSDGVRMERVRGFPDGVASEAITGELTRAEEARLG